MTRSIYAQTLILVTGITIAACTKAPDNTSNPGPAEELPTTTTQLPARQKLSLSIETGSLTVNEDETLTTKLSVSDRSLFENIEIVEAPQHGKLDFADLQVTYQPNKDFHGDDSFSLIAKGYSIQSEVVRATIAVIPVNDVPIVNDLAAEVINMQPVQIALTASDTEEDAISFAVVTGPTKGALSGTAPNLVYTPYSVAIGIDEFTYSATDSHGAVATGTVRVSIGGMAPILSFVDLAVGYYGKRLHIRGKDFLEGITVMVAGTVCSPISVSATQLYCDLPNTLPVAETHHVEIQNPNGLQDSKDVVIGPNDGLDKSFGVWGFAIMQDDGYFPNVTYAPKFIQDSTGRLLVATQEKNFETYDPKTVLRRFTSAGQPDISFDSVNSFEPRALSRVDENFNLVSWQGATMGIFDNTGKFVRSIPSSFPIVKIGNESSCQVMISSSVQAGWEGQAIYDGKIIFSRETLCQDGDGNFLPFRSFVVRMDLQGNLDSAFGTGGVVSIPDYAIVSHVLVQPDKKILVGATSGPVYYQDGVKPIVFRLNTDGSLDSTFGTGGVLSFQPVVPENTFHGAWVKSVGLQSNGKIIIVGSTINNLGGATYYIARFDATGQLDLSFADGRGYFTDTKSRLATTVMIDSADQIYVAAAFDVVKHSKDGASEKTYRMNDAFFVFTGESIKKLIGFEKTATGELLVGVSTASPKKALNKEHAISAIMKFK